MQTPAALDLAHTRPRPVHWLATAAAMAAVVAVAGLLQPEAATASQTAPAAAGPADTAPPAAPDASSAVFPLDCRGHKPGVVKQGSGDLDGDGRPETVAVVRCVSGIGTPPSGVFVLTGPSRVVATLVDPADGVGVTDLAVRAGTVSATLLGYSSPEVPRCCPDRRERVKWQWKGGKFARTVVPDARSM
ncbi:hypothetical protein AR457_27855 [Streptomyces agglomeratus]|uniref:Secreted protein n=1 Tax=Streptomyces agglomeratus TaxID=285458 RepID=A0A1E5PDW0_9ACTN|nr:hypothetical protein [Streptomyces agglomeratus]OEJ27713.1 hypothetical protein AS594_27735 [Streptomyces agglomeratus]OEJ42233.1 hypothetical protein BGK70_08800 [Streptomyces agglomeratus]OEJ47389.1 hypothetical protein AR457_27855 [Streptomyces agglomeratus]OEJ55546.1 hypothetical protein BGK72_08275 [Streptomyces agglomeratus]OEJ62926.1 hypothetical protein BGM19_09145 [Streptomyces agglomeratus]